jgi:hypothetical protein
VLDLHGKAKGVAACATAKAVEALVFREHDERRSLFLVEGAETGEVAARLAQVDMLTDQLNDIDAFSDLVYDIIRHVYPPCPDQNRGTYSS